MDSAQFVAQSLHIMAKPIGPICNLDCEYCYYLHKTDLYDKGERWRISDVTLDTYIRQYIAAQPRNSPEITFAWQGGEPTLLGIDFFRQALELQKHYAPSGVRLVNALQTNGILLDESWCEFFAANGFLIGLSIDGPAELHDRYRCDKQGQPTFAKVLRGLKLLKSHGVEFNALVVVNRHNGNHGRRVYTYLRDNEIQFFQFIPIVERRGVGAHAESVLVEDEAGTKSQPLVSSRSVEPLQFGQFLIDVFQEWIQRDVGRVFVQTFDQALSAWLGIEPTLCIFRKECGRALAMEHNGDLFCCDHFVEPAYRLGNIHELPLAEMANSERQVQFSQAKQTTLPEYCRSCKVLFACHGECPKNRFLTTPDGEPGWNYLCAGYRKFFRFIDPYMQRMAEELRQQRPAANVMRQLQSASRKPGKKQPASSHSGGQSSEPRHRPPSRNDLCPCGSGRKYKKCCLRNA